VIRITIELVSARGPEHDAELGQMLICNTGKGTDPKRGDYTVYLGKRGVTETEQVYKKPLRVGEVKDYPRLTYSVWILIARALKSVGIEKWSDFKEEGDV
jgi:hypothetical protein